MLFCCVVYQDVDLGELLDGFRDGLSTELFLTDVACKQQAFAAVFFAAAERERAERRAEARFACRDNAFFDAARRPSRLSAALVARDRVREVLLRPPLRPLARSRLAWRFVRFLPRFGGGNFTPALRAFDRPMAIACCGERAPCSPSRICSISSRTNSPAWVEGDLPSRSSSRALSTGSSSGIPIRFAPHDTFGCYEKCAGRRVYLITLRIEQLTITENISRDGNDYKSYAPRGPGEKEHYP